MFFINIVVHFIKININYIQFLIIFKYILSIYFIVNIEIYKILLRHQIIIRIIIINIYILIKYNLYILILIIEYFLLILILI